jgi:hypothetical protein
LLVLFRRNIFQLNFHHLVRPYFFLFMKVLSGFY